MLQFAQLLQTRGPVYVARSWLVRGSYVARTAFLSLYHDWTHFGFKFVFQALQKLSFLFPNHNKGAASNSGSKPLEETDLPAACLVFYTILIA